MNFGEIKQNITEQFTQSLLKESKGSKKLFKNFIQEINKSPILKSQFVIYSNLENKHIKEESKAIRYIQENLNLIEKFTHKDLISENKKLDKFIVKEKTTNQCECIKNLHENLDILIKQTITDNKDPDKKHNSFEVVLDYLMTEDVSKKEQNKYKLNNQTYLSNQKIVEIAINKFNDKYSFFNKNEKEIFTVLFNNDNKGKELVFETIKKENINQIKRKLIESDDVNLSDRLKLVENKLKEMTYSEDDYIEDIVKLNKLSLGF